MNIKSKMTEKTVKDMQRMLGVKLTLGKLIWAIRQADNISQMDFAEKLSISKQQLCDIEHNRKCISPKLAAKYAEILGYSKEQFIRLTLQDMVDRDGLNVHVEVCANKGSNKHRNPKLAA